MSLYRGKAEKRQMVEVGKQPWLPQQVRVSLYEVMGAAKEGLLALAVAVGLDVLRSMMEAEVTAIVGLRGKHNPSRKAFRHGTEEGRVVLGGRKVPIQRPRVRTKDGHEVRLESYEAFQDEQLLTEAALERMLHGLSTRRYHHGLEPVGGDLPAVATSKSSVSRHFVAATRKALAELLARPLGDQRYLVLMLDGIEVADHTVVVALGITADGQKQILGLWEGATENAAVCRSLLADLVERGLRVDRGILVVMDGAKALRAAVRDVLGTKATVQRCQVHKKRNVLDHLPDEARTWVSRKLDQAWAETDYEKARAALTSLAKSLEDKYPGAAASLREGLDETLTVLRLELPEALRKTLRSTNPIESAFDKVRMASRNVKRWRNGQQVLRWTSAGLLEAEKGFRRIKGYRQLPMLANALHTLDLPEQSSTVKTA
jgi:putative transposase